MPTNISNINNFSKYLLDTIKPKFDLPLPNLPNLTYYQEIKYQFKTYKDFHDPNIKGIKINLSINVENVSANTYTYKTNIILVPNQCIKEPLEYGDYFNNLVINEKYCTWNSARAVFHLTFDGKLTITSKQTITTQNLIILGIHELSLVGEII